MAIKRLRGKVALVTGSGRGIGPTIARTLARKGAFVIVHYAHSRDGAERTVADIVEAGGDAMVCQADIAKRNEVAAMFERIDQRLGRVDILVNNAGLGVGGSLEEATDEKIEAVFGVNAFGPLYATVEAAKRMNQGGRIVNFGSTAQEFPTAGAGLYQAAKYALKSFTSSWAKELGSRGITVNMVIPGATSPGMIDNSPRFLEAYEQASPFKRIGRADEIAAVVAFLVSEDASWVSGAHIVVNGAANA